MAKYLLIASRDPFETNEIGHCYDLAKGLRREGNDVTVFLVQNGVLGARKCTVSAAYTRLAEAGVTVLADSFSLRERGISGDRLAEGVQPGELETVVDHLADGRKVIWH